MNFSSVSPSHELQFFTNCPSMGPSHGVQSFRNRLLQRVSPTGSQALPANLLWCGLLSSQGHSLLWVSTCSTVDLHGLQGDSLPHHGLLHGLQGYLCSGAWSTSSPSFFTDLGVCRAVLSHILTLSPAAKWPFWRCGFFFFFFLNMLSQRHYHHHCWARPWPAAGPSWSWLALALSNIGEASNSFSQKPPL